MLALSSISHLDSLSATAQLLRQTHLTADNQFQIEDAISAISLSRNCSRLQAGQLLHQLAYSEC